jgi:translation initiation factor IF-3
MLNIPIAFEQNMTSPKKQEGLRINQDIKVSKIRLINENGDMVGVVSTKEALMQAKDAGLDLVEISPQSDPPVCKILNYGKYKYEQQKKKHEAKKNQKVVDLKEVQFRPAIDENDFQVKCKSIQRFLNEGHKVKILLRFRGRELEHKNIGIAIMDRVQKMFETISKLDHPAKLEGKQILMILSPKKGEEK